MKRNLERHSLAKHLPEPAGEDYAALLDSVRRNGPRNAVVLYEDKILDGWWLYRACLEAGRNPRFETFRGTRIEALELLIDCNLRRRHLTAGQVAMIERLTRNEDAVFVAALERKKAEAQARMLRGKPAESPAILRESTGQKKPHHSIVVQTVAEQLRVSPRYVEAADRIVRAGRIDLAEKVAAGTLTPPQAEQVIRREEKLQQLQAKAAAVPPSVRREWKIICGEVPGAFAEVTPGSARLVFADPPYNLGFEVPYQHGSESRRYRPDFIVLVDDGHGDDDLLRLVVEIKGYRGEDAREKKATMDTYWVPGVNNLATCGRWAFAEFCEVWQIQSDFKARVDSEFGKMIAEVSATP